MSYKTHDWDEVLARDMKDPKFVEAFLFAPDEEDDPLTPTEKAETVARIITRLHNEPTTDCGAKDA